MENHQSSATSGVAPLLLRLPREIRDMIYDHVLTEETPDNLSYEDPYEHAIGEPFELPGRQPVSLAILCSFAEDI
jgi:hypothetical protein